MRKTLTYSRRAALVTAAGVAGAAATLGFASPAAAAAPVVYLTFDDGPHPKWTPQILDILKRYGARATFYVMGQNVDRYPSITRLAHLRGHSIQNHTWDHPDLTTLSLSAFQSQITRTDNEVRAITGYTPKTLRPPYGAINDTVRSRASDMGKKIRLWDVDPFDWDSPGTNVIVSRVLNNVSDGDIVLMHDGGDQQQTVAALPIILDELKDRGYEFWRIFGN